MTLFSFSKIVVLCIFSIYFVCIFISISVNESWLLNGLYEYFLNSNSERAMEILVNIKEPHHIYLFDRYYQHYHISYSIISKCLLSDYRIQLKVKNQKSKYRLSPFLALLLAVNQHGSIKFRNIVCLRI